MAGPGWTTPFLSHRHSLSQVTLRRGLLIGAERPIPPFVRAVGVSGWRKRTLSNGNDCRIIIGTRRAVASAETWRLAALLPNRTRCQAASFPGVAISGDPRRPGKGPWEPFRSADRRIADCAGSIRGLPRHRPGEPPPDSTSNRDATGGRKPSSPGSVLRGFRLSRPSLPR